MSYRKEKKYKLTAYELESIKGSLIGLGMNRLFEPRYINSLYYDTAAHDMYYNSEEGVLPRKKVRVRWYNSATSSSLETKYSSIEGRFKTVNSMGEVNQDDFPRSIFDQLYGVLEPSLLVSYQREYFSYNSMRITFDSAITYRDKRKSSINYEDPERVMEIKVGIDVSDDYIENLIPYPTARFSKYSRGLLFSNRDM